MSSSVVAQCQCTPLMMVEVVALVPPCLRGYIRCAGTAGVAAYTELVEQRRELFHMEFSVENQQECLGTPHSTAPLSRSSKEDLTDEVQWHFASVLVVHHKYLQLHKTLTFRSLLDVLSLSLHVEIRYVGDPSVHSIGSVEETTEDDEIFVSAVTLRDFEGVTSVQSSFFSGFAFILTMDLSPLVNVTAVGPRFMTYCSLLETIDLTPLRNLTVISNDFMSDCPELTTIDFSGFVHVTIIGDHLLAACSGLTGIVLEFPAVRSIGRGFLRNCDALTAADMSTFGRVETVGDFFLSGCDALIRIDLSPFKSVRHVKGGVLSGCTEIEEIKLDADGIFGEMEDFREMVEDYELNVIQ